MRRERRLLRIEPQELTFRFELRRRASCTIRLSNNSREYVAFKVMATSREKYSARPNIGILLPGSSSDVEVIMHDRRETTFKMQCRDEFFINSVIASEHDTAESARNLFKERGHVVEVFPLRVVFVPQSSNSQRQDRNGRHGGSLFIRGVTFVLLCFIFGYIIMKMLQYIWTLFVIIIMFVIRMITRQVSDSVEEWIQKTLLYLCIQFLPIATETLLHRCVSVVCETIQYLCTRFLSEVFQQQ